MVKDSISEVFCKMEDTVVVCKPTRVFISPHGVTPSLHQLSSGVSFPVYASSLFYLKKKLIQRGVVPLVVEEVRQNISNSLFHACIL